MSPRNSAVARLPLSLPVNIRFFLPRAKGRMAFSVQRRFTNMNKDPLKGSAPSSVRTMPHRLSKPFRMSQAPR
jgi:hypothetical protein